MTSGGHEASTSEWVQQPDGSYGYHQQQPDGSYVYFQQLPGGEYGKFVPQPDGSQAYFRRLEDGSFQQWEQREDGSYGPPLERKKRNGKVGVFVAAAALLLVGGAVAGWWFLSAESPDEAAPLVADIGTEPSIAWTVDLRGAASPDDVATTSEPIGLDLLAVATHVAPEASAEFTHEAALSLIDLTTGGTVWKVSIEEAAGAEVDAVSIYDGGDDEHIAVVVSADVAGDDVSQLLVYSATTGDLLGSTDVPSTFAPDVASDGALFVAHNAESDARGAHTVVERWELVDVEGGPEWSAMVPRVDWLTVEAGAILLDSVDDGTLAMLDAATGAPLDIESSLESGVWKTYFAFGDVWVAVELEREGTGTNLITGLDSAGSELWRKHTERGCNRILDEHFFTCGVDGDGYLTDLRLVDLHTGEYLWDAPATATFTRILGIRDGMLYLTAPSARTLTAVDLGSGEVVARCEGGVRAIAVGENAVYAEATGGDIGGCNSSGEDALQVLDPVDLSVKGSYPHADDKGVYAYGRHLVIADGSTISGFNELG